MDTSSRWFTRKRAWAPLPLLAVLLLLLLLLAVPRAATAQDHPEVPGEEEIERTISEYEQGDMHVYRYWKVHDPRLEGDYRLILITYEEWPTKESMPQMIRADILDYAPPYGKFVFTGFENEIYAVDSGYFASDDREAEFARVAEVVRTYIREQGLAEGWPEPEEGPGGEEGGEDGQEERGHEPGGEAEPRGGEQGAVGGAGGIGPLPGPGSWAQAITGMMLPGLLGLLLGLLSMFLRGGGFHPLLLAPNLAGPGPAVDAAGPRAADAGLTSFALPREPAGAALAPPAAPFSEGEVQLTRSLESILRAESTRAEWAAAHPELNYYLTLLDESAAAAVTAGMEGVEAVTRGVKDLAAGMALFVKEQAAEWGKLGYDLVYKDHLGTLKEMVTPGILADTARGMWESVEPGINPMEELRALRDGFRDWWRDGTVREDALWAVPSLAIKAADMVGIGEGINWVRNRVLHPPRKPIIPKGKPLDTGAPAAEARAAAPEAGGKPRVSEAEARAAGEKAAPAREVAEHRLIEMDAGERVDRLVSRVESGRGVSREDVAEIMRDEVAKRRLMEEAPAEVREALAKEQRAVYDATDEKVIRGLRTTKEYAGAKIEAVEVSTKGRADAASGSADRDVIYLAEKEVTVVEGGKPVTRTVTEAVPAEKVEAAYHEAFAEQMGFDPSKPARGYSYAEWEGMSLAEKRAAFAEECGQTLMGRTHKHFIVEYRQGARPGELRSDPAMMGDVYYDKFAEHWSKGDVYSQKRALFQLRKAGKVAGDLGLPLDEKTRAALRIVADDAMSPAARDLAVRELGIRGGADGLANKIASMLRTKR